MRKFDIPEFYQSPIISKLKIHRKKADPYKKDYSPTELDFGPVKFYIARHFGFCYGVENAIEIAYRIISENQDKRIFLLSEIIHNPGVNSDLSDQGVGFLFDHNGRQLIEWNDLNKDDIVIIPAFGTTLEIENQLKNIGINISEYDTTCPFVEKVWNRAASLSDEDCTVVIHGKASHEETKATFSHSIANGKSIIVRDLSETKILAGYILGELSESEIKIKFRDKFSSDFDFTTDLEKIGVVNQTTMLSSETEAIAGLLKDTMIKKYGGEEIDLHFADTRDTLCYATNDNQRATLALLEKDADFAIVIGGYNSSNTTHIVELLDEKFPSYFISDEKKILCKNEISFFNIFTQKEEIKEKYLPTEEKIKIVLTSGASCPDSVVDRVMLKILSYFKKVKSIDEVLKSL